MTNQIKSLGTNDVPVNPKLKDIKATQLANGNGVSRLSSLPSSGADGKTQPTFLKKCQEGIKVKDGGYAWVVLGAMFMINYLSFGYAKGFGIIYNAILDVYPETSGVMSGLMMGLMSCCRTMFAPVAGAISNVIGVRSTLCFGCALYVAALAASFFCTSTMQLAFTLGALPGLSQCIVDTCQVVVVAQFFQSKLSLANGIRVAGYPCGGILLPFLFTALLEVYGLKLMFILTAGVISHMFICAFLMRPIDVHFKIKTLDYMNSLPDNWAQDLEMGPVPYRIGLQKKDLYHSILNQNATFSSKKKKTIDLDLLKNPLYILYLLMAALYPLGGPLVTFYIAIYAKTEIGLSAYEISLALALQSVFDFILRIFVGWLNNKKLYKLSNGFVFCMGCGALGSVLVPLAKDLWTLLFLMVLNCFGSASFHTFINVMLCEKFGEESVATSWGFVRMVQGVFNFLLPSFIGYVFDQTGTYTVPFLLMGFGTLLCGLMIFFESLVVRMTNNNPTNWHFKRSIFTHRIWTATLWINPT